MEIARYEPLVDLVFRSLSIYRWNNFPRIEEVTTLDHTGFSLHISLLLASLLEERDREIRIDRDYIVRSMLFRLFFTASHSDINHETKRAIQEKNPTLYKKLKESTYDTILKLPMHDIFRAEMYATVYSDGWYTGHLLEYARLYATYIEAHTNSRVYPEVYARPLQDITDRMNDKKYDNFRMILPYDGESEVYHFLVTIRRLQSTYRWNRERRMYPVSVMSHSVIVMFFSYILLLEKDIEKNDITDTMIRSLYHDAPEVLTGDILTPTKESHTDMRPLLEEIEREKVENEFLSYIRFSAYSHKLRSMMLSPWEGELGRIAKLADTYSALYEAKIEIPTNEGFREVYERIKKLIL